MAAFVDRDITQLHEIFQTLDAVREQMESVSWGIPKVIVFGAESTGKSTILERIAMLPIFPEGKDLCTRMAVDVRLRYANQTKRTAQLGVYLTEDGLAPDGYKSQPLDIDSPDGKNKVREIMEMITNVDGKRTVDKEKTIRITVKGRDLPNLDLLDLPGLVGTANDGETTIVQDTQDLVEKTIRTYKDRAIFLAVRDSCDNIRTQGEDGTGNKTLRIIHDMGIKDSSLGVLTMCDEMGKRDMDELKKKIEQEDVKILLDKDLKTTVLRHGYVATSNEPPRIEQGKRALKSDLTLEDLKDIASKELAWFNDNGFDDLVKEGKATTSVLIEKLQAQYLEFVKKEWLPKTVRRLYAKQKELWEEDKMLGHPSTRQGDRLGGPAGEKIVSVKAQDMKKAVVNKIIQRLRNVEVEAMFTRVSQEEMAPLMTELEALCKGKGVFSDSTDAICKTDSTNAIYKLLSQISEEGGLGEQLIEACGKTIDAVAGKLEGGAFADVLKSDDKTKAFDSGEEGWGSGLRLSRFPKLQATMKEVLSRGGGGREKARGNVKTLISSYLSSLVPKFDLEAGKATVTINKDDFLNKVVHSIFKDLHSGFTENFEKLPDAFGSLDDVDTDWKEECNGERDRIFVMSTETIPTTLEKLQEKFAEHLKVEKGELDGVFSRSFNNEELKEAAKEWVQDKEKAE
ncbi:hypothetical protein TrRE_jg7749, partial [Triparma retinervis]